ncbi:HIG1 domain-containing protein [Novosphingobium cyanobacteriorum]|uniref:HIG1 domain-containing protein n=1 Tax=Novosphingobium cyanobacteriorum TaxID=3024215 RepID=A0ABT6CIJ3_9SPHN|nr:HIG1 domain-containing protein [Novosphingobium cyanobacteriorum]MDF8333108.1 HIG1 domain-containing protein [Novosphingobium cyanobacteriorum]
MNYLLIPLLLIFMGLAVYSLVRGIVAFLKTTREGLERGDEGIKEMQLLQNRMMWNRVKFQGLAVLVVAVLLAFSHK